MMDWLYVYIYSYTCVCVWYIYTVVRCTEKKLKYLITYTVDLDYYEGSVLVPEPTNT